VTIRKALRCQNAADERRIPLTNLRSRAPSRGMMSRILLIVGTTAAFSHRELTAGLGELGASRILNLGVSSAAFGINDFAVEARAFKVIFKRPRNRIAVIPMPHSKIFKSESHLRAH